MKNGYIKTILRLMHYVTNTYKLQFTAVIITIVISALAGTAGPLFLMVLVDDFITPLLSQQSKDFTRLFYAILLMGGFYYIGVICTYIYSRLMVNIGQGVLKRVRDEMFEHMQTLSVRYFDSHPHGELMSLYTNDTDTLRQMISQSIPQVFSAFISVITIFCVMLAISPHLSIIAIIMVTLMMYLTKKLGGKSGTYFIAQQKDLSTINGYVEEMMSGQKVIKVFCHEEETEKLFDKLNENLCTSATNANKYANVIMPIMGNLGNLQYVITAVAGALLAMTGVANLSLGAIVSFLQFTRSFNMPFSQISQQFNSIIMALAGAGRIFELMDEPSETDEGDVTLIPTAPTTWSWKKTLKDGSTLDIPLCGDVRFEHMSFGYNTDKTILHDLTLYAKPGQKVAFVGSTGAGKTTITNLINRFYDVKDGEIFYDGIHINDIKKEDLRRSLGIVLQDTHLFTGTILENIRYGKLSATDEEIYAAAKLANADCFIRMLPNGYHTKLSGNCEEISQGQRQLLSIARAAVADPPVLILDEATSSIDTRTETLVQQGMDRLMSGRTVFVIAHRLSTIRNADAILVLEQGRIIERGEHEELMKKKGTYYQLYTGALELA